MRSIDGRFNFVIKDCKGKKMSYESNPTDFKDLMEKNTDYLTIAALCTWLFGSFSHKMIGVETINSIQTMAIALIFAPNYYPTLDRMNGLSKIIGGFQNIITNNTFIE